MKVLASYNIKGGVGKTAGAVNLAHEAARRAQRTLLWDLDPQGAASWYYRIEAKVKGGSERLLRKKRALSRAIRASDFERLDLVPADFSYRDLDLDLNATGKARQKLAQLLETVREEYDLVVLDCPPSISLLSESVFRASDALLVPTIPTVLSLRTLEQLAQHLKDRTDPLLLLPYFCLVDRRKRAHREIIEQAAAAKLGFLETGIPYSAQVENMGAERNPVHAFAPRSTPARRFAELWQEVEERLSSRQSARLRRKRLRAIYRPGPRGRSGN